MSGYDPAVVFYVEGSDAFGFANTTKENAAAKEAELRAFFRLIEGKSPVNIEAYLPLAGNEGPQRPSVGHSAKKNAKSETNAITLSRSSGICRQPCLVTCCSRLERLFRAQPSLNPGLYFLRFGSLDRRPEKRSASRISRSNRRNLRHDSHP